MTIDFRSYVIVPSKSASIPRSAWTLAERQLDFANAARVIAGLTYTRPDERFAYSGLRFQTYGLLDGRLVMVVWSAIENGRRIISMRKCNEREQQRFGQQLD